MNRWIIGLGRGGMVVVAISLALFLVSFIPATQVGHAIATVPLYAETIFTGYHTVLTPQQELRVNGSVEGAINIYLLEAGREPLTGVGSKTEIQDYTGITRSGAVAYGPLFANATELQTFLEEYPERIIWMYNLEDEVYEYSYSPTRVMNATFVAYNPSSANATLGFEVTVTSRVAPEEKVLNIALWATPTGLVLAIPWITTVWKRGLWKVKGF
jgi:hypothetical protein